MRHYKALMNKNFINWKRDLGGSITEIGLPVILCLIIINTWAHSVWVELNFDNSIETERIPLYPAWTLNNQTGNWSNSWSNSFDQTNDYRNFFNWANYTTDVVTDPRGPYWWTP